MPIATKTTSDGVFTLQVSWSDDIEEFSEETLDEFVQLLLHLAASFVEERSKDDNTKPQGN